MLADDALAVAAFWDQARRVLIRRQDIFANRSDLLLVIAESFVNQLGLPAKPVQRESTFFEGLSQGAESGQAGACGKERLAKIASAVGDVATAFDESFGIQPEELLELQLLQAAETSSRVLRDSTTQRHGPAYPTPTPPALSSTHGLVGTTLHNRLIANGFASTVKC